jgi:UDP-N-acetylglucosamine diphosphorylase/glucosamine-1-phosphate N-acetyltransferase
MNRKIAIVMAAGMGTRMKSDLPKVLVPVAGRPMVEYVLDALAAAGVDRVIVVVGYRGDDVRCALADRRGLEFVYQAEQLGTGHALMVCREAIDGHDGPVLVLAGDSPMMRAESLAALLDDYDRRPAACILGTTHKEDPTGLGRVVRDENGGFLAIVEEKDATDAQRRVTEVNMSYYVFRCRDLLEALEQIRPNNVQGEYYITDCPGVMKAAGKDVRALDVLQPCEAMGINTAAELAAVEAALRDGGAAPPPHEN